jgi:hypothetical protein
MEAALRVTLAASSSKDECNANQTKATAAYLRGGASRVFASLHKRLPHGRRALQVLDAVHVLAAAVALITTIFVALRVLFAALLDACWVKETNETEMVGTGSKRGYRSSNPQRTTKANEESAKSTGLHKQPRSCDVLWALQLELSNPWPWHCRITRAKTETRISHHQQAKFRMNKHLPEKRSSQLVRRPSQRR